MLLDRVPGVDQLLDRVGDLELATGRRLDRAGRVEDDRLEHVYADQRQVRRRIDGLFDEADDPLAVELGDAVVLGIEHLGEQDQRVGLVAAERLDEPGDPVAEQVVAEVHHERGVAEELLGGQDRVREPERLRLGDVGHVGAERRAVADGGADLVARLRGDHDPDLGDARVDERLDPVEEHRLVGDRYELLCRRMRDRPQARSGAPGEDQAL